jgi:hypothetical protein
MLGQIAQNLKEHFNAQLVDELLSSYQEAKHNFFLGGLRLSAVEGGRFCEAALRMLQEITAGAFTPLNNKLDTDRLIQQLANLPRAAHSDSIRIHMPRTIRVVYDIRNNRDTAHLADGIDPNLQDATLVISNLDWILAEFVRQYHNVAAAEAQRIVDGLVSRVVPAIQDFDGFLKVLNPRLRVSDYLLLLLYERGATGAVFPELEGWVRPAMRTNLRRALARLVDDNAFVHSDGQRFYITKRGAGQVERRNLHNIKR